MNANEARMATLEAKKLIQELQQQQKAEEQVKLELEKKQRLASALQDYMPYIQRQIQRATEHGYDLATYNFETSQEQDVLEVLAQRLRLDGFEVWTCEAGTWIQITW